MKNKNKNLNEALSIANEVLEICKNIRSIILEKTLLNKNYKDIAGIYYKGSFKKNLFGIKFTIKYKCYSTLYIENILHGRTVIKDRLLELLVCKNQFLTFDSIIIHELLHIYQYVKNKIDYDKQGSNKKLYNIVGKILGNKDRKYSDIKKTFASALYLTFPYEQDAMAHGLYKTLDEYPSIMINQVLENTTEYLFLTDIKFAIDNIDKFEETLFDNLLTKNKFLNMCKKSYNRYKTKIEHVVQHIIDNKSNLNEGLVHFIPTHHINRIKNNKQ